MGVHWTVGVMDKRGGVHDDIERVVSQIGVVEALRTCVLPGRCACAGRLHSRRGHGKADSRVSRRRRGTALSGDRV